MARLRPPPWSPGKPTRFPGTQKPSQFRSDSAACRGLRTEFRPFSRVLRLQSPASLCPQNSVSLLDPARGHVVDHALTKRADGLVGHRESSCLPWVEPHDLETGDCGSGESFIGKIGRGSLALNARAPGRTASAAAKRSLTGYRFLRRGPAACLTDGLETHIRLQGHDAIR